MALSLTHDRQGSIDGWVEQLLAEYAGRTLQRPLDARLSLRDDLAIESLSLVSLVVRLGDDLGLDAGEESLSLECLRTVGDLRALAHRLAGRA